MTQRAGGGSNSRYRFGSPLMSANSYSLHQPGTPSSNNYLKYPSVLESVLQRLSALQPSLIPTVTIGDALYYARDTGDSTVLVPLQEARPWSRSDDARRRRDVERIGVLLHATIGSGLYGLAKLLGASDRIADSVLGVGSIVDAALVGGARSGGRVRTPRAPPQRIDSPTQQQPPLRFGRPTASGQATRTNSTITSKQVGTGSKAERSIRPPGWQEQFPDRPRPDQQRGHLNAAVLGGTGRDPRNLMTIPSKTNQEMWSFEKIVRDRAKSGEVLEYQVQPFYDGPGQSPSMILMMATGTRGQPMGRVILVKKPNQP